MALGWTRRTPASVGSIGRGSEEEHDTWIQRQYDERDEHDRGGLMGEPETGDFDLAQDRRPFIDKGYVDILTLGNGTVGRATCEPGWRWSEHVKPIARTESCRMNHFGIILSGRLRWAMDDGTELETSAGEAFAIPPAHDSWVVGDEPCVFVDFAGMEQYAR